MAPRSPSSTCSSAPEASAGSSDFLLWEAAYAELVFVERMWPDFAVEDLAAAVREFDARERRFGGLPEVAADAS